MSNSNKPMTARKLKSILTKHGKWLQGEAGGERANLSYTNLRGADLSNADLSNAGLSYADLRGADLRGADLSNADLRGADLSNADLRGADLRGADLSYANLSDADLYVNSSEGVRGIQLLVIHLTQHRVVYRGDTGIVQIGCKKHSLGYWLEHYTEIGRKVGYSEQDIKMYGRMLRGLPSK